MALPPVCVCELAVYFACMNAYTYARAIRYQLSTPSRQISTTVVSVRNPFDVYCKDFIAYTGCLVIGFLPESLLDLLL